MIRGLVIAIVFTLGILGGNVAARGFDNESLTYRVMYKWGLINKQAGTAILTIHSEPHSDTYTAQLTAKSEPWADKFYTVRDTLNGIMIRDNLKPVFYEKIAHEGSDYKHDVIKYSYSGQTATGHATRLVYKKGELKADESRTLTAEGATVDMLSSFYVMRSLPFTKWPAGHSESISIFSGKYKENLTFKYHGIERVEVAGTHYQCFHITFIFTGGDGKKSSDNMDAWITTGQTRTPVLLEGKLPVGKVKCELINRTNG